MPAGNDDNHVFSFVPASAPATLVPSREEFLRSFPPPPTVGPSAAEIAADLQLKKVEALVAAQRAQMLKDREELARMRRQLQEAELARLQDHVSRTATRFHPRNNSEFHTADDFTTPASSGTHTDPAPPPAPPTSRTTIFTPRFTSTPPRRSDLNLDVSSERSRPAFGGARYPRPIDYFDPRSYRSERARPQPREQRGDQLEDVNLLTAADLANLDEFPPSGWWMKLPHPWNRPARTSGASRSE